MSSLQYTLYSDGSSDQELIPIISWLLHTHLPDHAVQAQWADLRRLPKPPTGLTEKLRKALELYPCDLLFVHRDAENQPPQLRYKEITEAVSTLALTSSEASLPRAVCVVPIRMQEAWLLIDPSAIRKAAGNPNGRNELVLPKLATVESMPDPKRILHDLLREASGLHGRRLRQFRPNGRRVAEFVEDFSPLRSLSAFNAFEQDLGKALS